MSMDMLACKLENFTRGHPEAKNYRKIMTTGRGDCSPSGKSPLLFVQCRVTSLEPVCTKKDKTASVGYTFVHAYLCLYATILIKGNRKSSVEVGAQQVLENKLDIIIFQSKPHIYQ